MSASVGSGGSGATAAPQPEEDGNESESDDLAEAEVMDDDDPASDLPAIVTDTVGDYTSAVKCWVSLIAMQLDLHADWDDHDEDERRKWGAKMQASGRFWVTAVRTHVNNKIF